MINDSLIHNNSLKENSGIQYDIATINSSKFTHNSIDSGYGLIDGPLGKVDSILLVTESDFLYNHGDVVRAESRVDIVLDTCNFTGNNGDIGTLCIVNDDMSLHMSNTKIIAPLDGNIVALYFTYSTGTDKATKMTDYLTHQICLISGNTTLNSSATDTFLHEAEIAGLVIIDKQWQPGYEVSQEETVFASGEYVYILVGCREA